MTSVQTIVILAGVRIIGLRPEVVLALQVVAPYFYAHGCDCIITCGTEGVHMAGSKHYSGEAVDLRSWHLPGEVNREHFATRVRSALGTDFDFIYEAKRETHFHLEFHPKSGINLG